jgi:hypothetical protein
MKNSYNKTLGYIISLVFGLTTGFLSGMWCQALSHPHTTIRSKHEIYYETLKQKDLNDGAFTEWLYEVEQELPPEETRLLVDKIKKKLHTFYLAFAGLTTTNQDEFIKRVMYAEDLLNQ